MDEPRTHLAIDRTLCGHAIHLAAGAATVELTTGAAMAAEPGGLVHGGFIFGAADYAAMLAVNEPQVVLAGATVKFQRPSRVGDVLRFEATVERSSGRRHEVEVTGRNEAGEAVFRGSFQCVVLEVPLG